MKQVRETAAGKSISAYVILKDGKEVATVQSYYGNSGRCQVDVLARGQELQQASAGGGGYDKFVSCLNGMTIDGITLNDHCGTNEATKNLLSQYITEARKNKGLTEKREQFYRNRAKKLGASFANWSTFYIVKGEFIESYNFKGGGDKEKTKRRQKR